MPNAIDQRLASRLAQQKIKLLAQSERAALNVGRVYDALLRDLLALATGDGVTDALARDAREAAERASVAARETLRSDLVASVQASRKATVATLLDTVPLRWFRAIAPELAVMPLPESLQERAADDPQFGAAYDFEPIAKRRLNIQSQIIWNKNCLVLGQADYHWKHENCWYAFWKGKKRRWYGERTQTTVWDVSKIANASYVHPMQKPVELYGIPMQNHTKQGEVVAEPFAGSGTQLIAAENLGRRCFGIEISPAYCAVILERMATAFPDLEIRQEQ